MHTSACISTHGISRSRIVEFSSFCKFELCLNSSQNFSNVCVCFQVGCPKTIVAYPFVFHSLSLSLFGAIIGPFGGFFASGFKRAFKIKDFGDIIPGHGGIVDRFDCQYLMAVFVHVYIASFISLPNSEKIMRMIFQLKAEDQIHILRMLEEHLDPTSN